MWPRPEPHASWLQPHASRLQPHVTEAATWPRLQPHVTEAATRRDAGWNSRLEWLLLMPRAHAATILRTASLFETCTPKQPSCCAISRSEDLLEVGLGLG